MGYMDISIAGSDFAADANANMIGAMVKNLTKALTEDANEFNTSGPVNVALIFKEHLLPGKFYRSGSSDLQDLAVKTHKALRIECIAAAKADWDDEKNKTTHLRSYRKLLRSMNRFINHYNKV